MCALIIVIFQPSHLHSKCEPIVIIFQPNKYGKITIIVVHSNCALIIVSFQPSHLYSKCALIIIFQPKSMETSEVKKFVPNKNGYVGIATCVKWYICLLETTKGYLCKMVSFAYLKQQSLHH